jgi:hypothetical protein
MFYPLDNLITAVYSALSGNHTPGCFNIFNGIFKHQTLTPNVQLETIFPGENKMSPA